MTLEAAVLGLVIGFLIGLTGMGGGAMMTPILIWAGWAPPTVAVGTNLLWTTITKIVGATVHYREKNVNLRLVGQLAKGSLPGALLGLYLFGALKQTAGLGYVDRLTVHLLGGTLITVALCIAAREYLHRRFASRGELLATPEALSGWQVPAIGFIVGVLVTFTSVGSGSLILTTLLLLFPGERLNKLVGSDIFHGLLLVGVAAFGHWRFGDVNLPLVSTLLIGSVPGVWLGSLLAGRVPDRVLRPTVAMLLFVTGVKLI